MGALTYHPAQKFENESADDNMDELAEQCKRKEKILLISSRLYSLA